MPPIPARRILVSRPTESEADLSFVALTDLLSPLVDEVRRLLSPPERRALDETLLRTDPGDEPIDLRALGMAFSRALTALAEQPAIVAIDDLHWIDGGSARGISRTMSTPRATESAPKNCPRPR